MSSHAKIQKLGKKILMLENERERASKVDFIADDSMVKRSTMFSRALPFDLRYCYDSLRAKYTNA